MPDAPVIPMDGDRPGRSGSAGAAGAGARSVSAGADRASGERARRQRRTTPLLADRDRDAVTAAAPPEEPPAKKATAKKTTAKKATSRKTAAKKASPGDKLPAKKAAATKPVAKKAATTKKSAAEKAAEPKPVREKPAWVVEAEKAAEPKPVREKPAWVVEAEKAAEPKPVRDKPAWVVEAEKSQSLAGSPGAGEKLQLAMAVATQAGEVLADVLDLGRRTQDAETALAKALDFVARRLAGEYEVDEFGFDAEFTDAVLLEVLRPLYRRWFRVEVRGIENVPLDGGALIVANHSGTIPVDGLMTMVAVHDEHPKHRFLRMLGADLVFELPFVAGLARKAGATLATNADAERLLSEGHLVGVWPEGFKGVGKPFSERYKLQRFGRGGFVSAALRTGTPIVPCSIVGAEEIYPIVGDVPALARLLGLPYVPITPFFPWLGPLGAIPLPSKWLIEFGPPLTTAEYGAQAAEDPMLVFDLTDRVRQTIQQTLYSLLVQRRSIFF